MGGNASGKVASPPDRREDAGKPISRIGSAETRADPIGKCGRTLARCQSLQLMS